MKIVAILGVTLGYSLAIVAYFLPAIIAYRGKSKDFVPILLMNIFFGWTLVAWLVALAWSEKKSMETK